MERDRCGRRCGSPVPDEVVGPTPRSKMRISISPGHDAHKLDVGLVGKIGVDADFRANVLPRIPGDEKFRVIDQNHKMRIPVETAIPSTARPSARITVFARSAWDSHARRDFDGIAAIGVDAVDTANANAGIRLNAQLITGSLRRSLRSSTQPRSGFRYR